jgi:ankyrin repeat protein
MIELLLKHGASLEPDKNLPNNYVGELSPLHVACSHYVPAIVIKLLASHAPSQINNKSGGKPPLHKLANTPTTEGDEVLGCAQILLDFGADPNIESDHRHFGYNCCYTATACSIFSESWDLAKLFLDRSASTDIGITGGHRCTLLHLLVYKAFFLQSRKRPGEDQKVTELIERLLNHPLAQQRNLLDSVDYLGFSPIHWALLWPLPHVVKILLQRGASTQILKAQFSTFDMIRYYQKNLPAFVMNDEDFIEGDCNEVTATAVPRCRASEYRSRLEEVRALLHSEDGR